MARGFKPQKLAGAPSKQASWGSAAGGRGGKRSGGHNGGYMKAGGAGNGGHGGVSPHGSSGSASITRGR